uniref:Poly A polymerase head domain-containing protein n=1 Tax=Arcella intermedia TaxID=1963864 RepID=A0A6B2LGX8_9EUKA
MSEEEIGLLNDLKVIFSGALDKIPFELYIVGGWVRDKVLGIHSHDIDIMITGISIISLYHKLADYIKSQKPHSNAIQGYNFWLKNPEKCKSNDTLMLKMHNIEMQILNPRSVPSDSSIIGVEQLVEDAKGRDFTVNALFYEVKSGIVLDLTGKGLSDVSQRLLRTPLEPMVTFSHDPIRILRGVRFLAKFPDFRITEEIKDFMLNDTEKGVPNSLSFVSLHLLMIA